MVRSTMTTFAAARAIALKLPLTEASTSYGTPAFKVRGKLFARLLEDGKTLVIKSTFDERETLVKRDPKIFFWTPHYERYEWVLVKLERIDSTTLGHLLTEAWRKVAPKKRT